MVELSKMIIREEIDDNTTVFIDADPKGSGLIYRIKNNGSIVIVENGVKSNIFIQIPKSDATRPAKKMRIEGINDNDDALMLD